MLRTAWVWQRLCPSSNWPAPRPLLRASELEHPGSQARCVAGSATGPGPLCLGSRPAPAGAPAPRQLQSSGPPPSLAALPALLPLPSPGPPEPHLRPVPWQRRAQILAAKGAPERGPKLRLGRGVQQTQTSKPSVPRAAASSGSALGRGGGRK